MEYYPTLVDTEDNSAAIDALNGTTPEVICLNTVVPLGWYVFTAPFDIPASVLQSKCAFSEVREFVGSSFVQGSGADMPSTVKLFFDVASEFKAGVPYLVKTAMERDFYIYTFDNMTVSNKTTIVESKYANFIPTLSQTTVTDAPQQVLFAEGPAVKSDNPPYNASYYAPIPYHPEAPAVIKGFSGYFWLTPEADKVFPGGNGRYEIVFGPYESETIPVMSLQVDKSAMTMNVNDVAALTAIVSPENASNRAVKWNAGSSNIKLYYDAACTLEVEYAKATETLTVYVKGMSSGIGTVDVTSVDNPNFVAHCQVTVANPTPTLRAFADNSAVLDEWDGKKTDLIVDAMLKKGWNIFTVPFDIPSGVISEYGLTVKEFVGSAYDKENQTVKLFFDDVTEMKASVPYLVNVGDFVELEKTPFKGVTVKKTPTTVCSIYANFIPTLSKTTVSGDPKTIILADVSAETYYAEPLPVEVLGLSGYFCLTKEMPEGTDYEIVFGPYEQEAITEEITEKPGDTAKSGETNTSESGITYTLGPKDFVDEVEGSITIHAVMTAGEMKDFLADNVPGSSEFYNKFKGLFFMLSAGKGKVEIEIETLGDIGLAIIQGLDINGEYTMAEKGTITIIYLVTQDTWLFAFPAVKSEASARGFRTPDSEGTLKIYSIKVLPSNEVVGIEETGTANAGNGYIYNLRGQRVTSIEKGLYIIDGKKVVMK